MNFAGLQSQRFVRGLILENAEAALSANDRSDQRELRPAGFNRLRRSNDRSSRRRNDSRARRAA
jgi:hypothetical protein